jgi:hypothetical protein
MQMIEKTAAPEGLLAGMLTGRGGFGINAFGEPWLYFTALDHEVAEEALELWGGRVTQKPIRGARALSTTPRPRG